MAIEITIASASLIESQAVSIRAMNFIVSLSAPAPSSGVSVAYKTRQGTATESQSNNNTGDYNNAEGRLTIKAGETSGIISVYVLGDSEDEVDESLFVELSNPVNAILSGNAPVLVATGTILDDDGSGSNLALFTSNPVLVEGNSGTQVAHIAVALSRAATTTIVVPYQTVSGTAQAGQDFVPTSGSVTFIPGQTIAYVDVVVMGDTAVEPTETFSVVFTPPPPVASGAAGAASIITILDDDAGGSALPTISIDNPSVSEPTNVNSPDFRTHLNFTVTLSRPAPATGVTMNYRTIAGTADGTDYVEITSGTLTIDSGQTTGTVTVNVRADYLDEKDEFMSLELSNPVGGAFAGNARTLRGIGTILDTAGTGSNLAVAISSPNMLEGASGAAVMHFDVLLSEAADSTIVIPYATANGTATAGQDYTAVSGNVTFIPGQTRASIDVPILGDTTFEPDETFSVVLSLATTAPTTIAGAVGTGTILNDDPNPAPFIGVINQSKNASNVIAFDAADAGGPSYLKWQYIYSGSDALAMSTQAQDVFIHSGSGNDAIQVFAGHNVLDGGTGSNFMTGGSGVDTFFTDARGTAVVWNTLRGYGAGDSATLWGFNPGVSSYRWEDNIAGAAGSEGATLRANIVGGKGRSGDGIDASITFTGLSVAQAKNLQIVTGTQPAGNYLFIYNPGV